MLFRTGFEQLKRNRGRTIGSIITIVMGMSILWGIGMTIDTLYNLYEIHEDFLYGGIDCTLFNSSIREEYEKSDMYFPGKHTLPSSYINTIKNIDGVTRVVSRMGSDDLSIISSDDYNDVQKNMIIYAINETNPDEDYIGTCIIINCLESYGTPENVTLSDLLTSKDDITHPAVFTDLKIQEYGWTVGDRFKIQARDLVKAYATGDDFASIENGSFTTQEIDEKIQRNLSLWIDFTITGVIVDGAESLTCPFSQKEYSASALIPRQNEIFISKHDADKYVYNRADEPVSSYFMITIDGNTKVKTIESKIKEIYEDASIDVYDLNAFLSRHRDFVVSLARSFLLAASALSIVVSAILSQSVMEMNLSDQLKDIGILRALGFKRKVIAEMIMPQILIISITGVSFGSLLGYIIPSMFDADTIVQLLSQNYEYEVTVTAPMMISFSTAITCIGVGLLFPVLFGIIPLLKLKIWDIDTLLTSESTERETSVIKLKNKILKLDKKGKDIDNAFKKIKIKQKMFVAIILIIGMIISSIGMYYAATKMFIKGELKTNEDLYTYFGLFIALLFTFVMFFLVMFKDIIQAFTALVSKIFGRWIGEIREYIPKRVKAATNKRNRRNLSNTLIIITTLVTVLFVIHETVSSRNAEVERSLLGCDIGIYYPLVPSNDLREIKTAIPDIEYATTVSYYLGSAWNFNKMDLPSFIVNSVDDFGGKEGGITNSLNVIVIQDIKSFIEVNPIGITFYEFRSKQRGLSIKETLYSLESDDNIIIQDKLAETINKRVGDDVELVLFGMQLKFNIVGIVSSFPSVPMMYVQYLERMNSRSVIISSETLSRKVREYFGGIDLMIKNRNMDGLDSISNETIPTNVSGITSGLINKNGVASILSGIEEISNYTFRFSTFSQESPAIMTRYDESRLIYATKNVNFTDGEMINMKMRSYVIEPETEMTMTAKNDPIIECTNFLNENRLNGYDGNRYYNTTSVDVLYGAKNFIYGSDLSNRNKTYGNTCYAIVNKFFTQTNEQGNVEFVYENKVNDTFTVTFESREGTIQQDFTIIATTGTHHAFYKENGTGRENLLISARSLNYDSNVNLNNSLVTFLDFIDIEANVLMTTHDEIEYMEFIESGFPFTIGSGDLYNHVYVSLKQDADPSNISRQIKEEANLIGLNNLSIVDIKNVISDKLGLGSLQVRISSDSNKQDVINKLETWYENHSYTFYHGYIGTIEKFNADWLVIADAFDIAKMIAVFTMIVSQIGLSIIIYMMMKTQRNEISIMKVLGYNNKTIMNMVTTESAVSSIASTFFGLIIGIFVMILFSYGVSASLLIPFYAHVPWIDLSIVITLSFTITLGVGILNARYVLKIPIDECMQ